LFFNGFSELSTGYPQGYPLLKLAKKIFNDTMRGANAAQEKRREASDEHSCIYTNYKNKEEKKMQKYKNLKKGLFRNFL
jgi:hypothetical protein